MLILSFFVFALTYLSPSDPVMLKYARMGETPDAAVVAAEREALGLNDPLMVQYGRWLWKALYGDLGESYKTGKPVWGTMLEHIPNTLKLTGATVLLTVVLCVPLGVVSAVNQNRFISFFGVYMPKKTGWEVLAEMQADDTLRSIPVIVLTVDQDAEARALEMGAMDFIPKPYPSIETLKARIAKCIALSERR